MAKRRLVLAGLIVSLVHLGGCSMLPGSKPVPEPVEPVQTPRPTETIVPIEPIETPEPTVVPEVEPLLGEWPEDAPPRELFIELYEADQQNRPLQSMDNYLGWVARFYEGRTLQPGWLGISEQVMEQTPEELQTQIRFRMQALGRNISGEWAKANRVRIINTRMVAIWHQAFTEAMKQGEVLDYLTRLEDDVTALLEGSLNGDEIAYARYYEDSFFF